MRAGFITSLLLLSTLSLGQAPAQNQKPLGKNQILALLKAGMESEVLAKTVEERGIDFEPSDDDFEALRKAGAQDVLIKAIRAAKPRAMTREQVLQLVVAGVPSPRAVTLVKQRGIDFLSDEEYLGTLRVAGADETLVTALRAAGDAVTGVITVVTSPNAEVLLDGELKGRADAQGQLAFKAMMGTHALKVSLIGKKDFQQTLLLAARQAIKIEARLADLTGSIRIRTSAGANISLDNSTRGTADASGESVLAEVSPGAHEVRVSAPRKKDYRQAVTVVAGLETRMEAALGNAPPSPGEVRENPKDGLKYVWIPPGRFMMGCSPGDNECDADEKPAHRVTISKGFWMGQAEVTVGAFKRFSKSSAHEMPKAPKGNRDWSYDAMPIVKVNWSDAHAFCH